MNKYMICTGYVRNAKTPIPANLFFEVWLDNVNKYANPEKVFVVCAGGARPTVAAGCQIHDCRGDLGHIRDKHHGKNNYPFTGWAGGMMLGALAAYNDCCDFIYKEQDCLAFGNWVDQLYTDLGPMGAGVLGRGLNPPHDQLKSSQSLFLVRHAYIPIFVSMYVAHGDDRAVGPTTGENKFHRMIQSYPTMWKRQTGSWNLDRDRNHPLDYYASNKSTFALQQITPHEFTQLKQLDLI